MRLKSTLFFAISFAARLLGAQVEATFQVQPLGGQSTFRVGERIPLELRFSSTAKDRFEINMASSDRSGRMSYEQFDVSPKGGWSDPLAGYFSTGHIGGGMFSLQTLGTSPTVLSIGFRLPWRSLLLCPWY